MILNKILDIGFGILLLLVPIILVCLPIKFLKVTRLNAANISSLLCVLLVTPMIISTGIGGAPMYAIFVFFSYKTLPYHLGLAIDAFWMWTLPSIVITAICGWLVSYYLLPNNSFKKDKQKSAD